MRATSSKRFISIAIVFLSLPELFNQIEHLLTIVDVELRYRFLQCERTVFSDTNSVSDMRATSRPRKISSSTSVSRLDSP